MSSPIDDQDYTERCSKVIFYTPDPEKIFKTITDTRKSTATIDNNRSTNNKLQVKKTNLNTSLLPTHGPTANNHMTRTSNNIGATNPEPSSPSNMHFQSQSQPQQNASLINRVVNQTMNNNQPFGQNSPNLNTNGMYDAPLNNGMTQTHITASLNYGLNVQSVTPTNNQQMSTQNRSSQRSELSQLLEFGTVYMPTSTGSLTMPPNNVNRDEMRDFSPECSMINHISPGPYQNQYQNTNQVNSTNTTSMGDQFRFRQPIVNSHGLDNLSTNFEPIDSRSSIQDQSFRVSQQSLNINTRQEQSMIQSQNPSCLVTNNSPLNNMNNARIGFIPTNANYSSNYFPNPAHMTPNIAQSYRSQLPYRPSIAHQQQMNPTQHIILRQAHPRQNLRRNLSNPQPNSNSNMQISYANQQYGPNISCPQPTSTPQQQVAPHMTPNVTKTYTRPSQVQNQAQIQPTQSPSPQNHQLVYSQANVNQMSNNVCQAPEQISSAINLQAILSNDQQSQAGTNQISRQPQNQNVDQRSHPRPKNPPSSVRLEPQVQSNNKQAQSTTSISNGPEPVTRSDTVLYRNANIETRDQGCQTDIQPDEVVPKPVMVDRASSPICTVEPVKRKTTAKRPRRELVRPSSSSGTDVELSD